jgi:hypothetical protein
VDPRNAEQFAAAMQRIIGGEYDYDSEAADRYVAAADPMKFVQLLIA